MGSSLVIVAVPDENDHVWKISSEEVPHLTILYLGEDVEEVDNVDKIVSFVEHAADTMLRRFYLTVDRRGKLGTDEADVVFFKKDRYDFRAVWEFRSALLKDANIKKAYDASPQFDGWNPHLTLGYPAAPAKEDDNWGPLYSVCFNQIQVWTGDSEGPSFLLKDWDYADMAMDSIPMDVSMSDIRHASKVSDTKWSSFKDSDYTDEQYARACVLDRGKDAGTAKQRYSLPIREPDGTLNRNGVHAAAAALSGARGGLKDASDDQKKKAASALMRAYSQMDEDPPESLANMHKSMMQTVDLGAEFVEHYGVKGMRWGQRKDTQVTVNGQTKMVTEKKAQKLDTKFVNKSTGIGAYIKLHNQAADGVNAEIGAFNDRFHKKYPKEMNDGTLWNSNHPVTKEYHKAYNEMLLKHLDKAAADMGTSPTGKIKITIDSTSTKVPVEEFGWSPRAEKVKHAAVDEFPDTMKFVVELDAQGQIVSIAPVLDEPVVAQSAVERGAAFIAHYGVKGMRWGVRKAQAVTTQEHIDAGIIRRRTRVRAKGGVSAPAHNDAVKAAVQKQLIKKSGTDALSTQELRDLANRLQVEQQVQVLMTTKGKKFVAKQLESEGKQAFRKGATAGVKKVAKGGGRAAGAAALLV